MAWTKWLGLMFIQIIMMVVITKTIGMVNKVFLNDPNWFWYLVKNVSYRHWKNYLGLKIWSSFNQEPFISKPFREALIGMHYVKTSPKIETERQMVLGMQKFYSIAHVDKIFSSDYSSRIFVFHNLDFCIKLPGM